MRPAVVRTTLLLLLTTLAACDAAPFAPPVEGPFTGELAAARGGGGKKPKPDDPPPEPDPDPVPAGATWQLQVADDADPLWRFTRSGNDVLLQTDPTVTGWGTDYWGYWSEPFPIDGDDVAYTIGLTHTTYTLLALGDGRVDVTKTLIVQPYLGGSPTTTVTHVGVFAPVE